MSLSASIVTRSINSPVGELVLGATGRGLCFLEYSDRPAFDTQIAALRKVFRCDIASGTNGHLDQAIAELELYFSERLTTFTTPLDIAGTPFQVSVWNCLRSIPYGRTFTYAAVAEQVGRPGAQRAVGRANGDNKIAIVIPCHRVVQAGGVLRGYGGGLWRKQFLLDLECRGGPHA